MHGVAPEIAEEVAMLLQHHHIDAGLTAGELSPAVDLDATFEAFFCLYFGLVVGGLRGELTRRRQSAVLRSTLAAMLGGAR